MVFRKKNIINVTVESGVTSIGDLAFYYCVNLSNITIPDSVTSIGDYAFSNCSSLTSVTIPDSMTSIGEWAFYYCVNLSNITIPDSVTSIGNGAFSNCSCLTSITIPDSVITIGNLFIGFCDNLTSITVESGNNNYSSLDGNLFDKQQTTLIQYAVGKQEETYTIPGTVTSIGDCAFYSCDNLTSITILDSVTSIGDETFAYCNNLTSVMIPDSVTNIGDWAFSTCRSLTSITIPNSVTSIGEGAFSNCYRLTNITIPDSVTSIGDYAFYYCDLTSITVESGNNNYSSLDGNLFDKQQTTLIQYAVGKQEETYTIPGTVTSIGDCAFYSCDNLTSITIPDSVTSIGDETFAYCNNLTSVMIPDSVTSIGNEVFYSCDNLTSVTIPYSVTNIGYETFTYCVNLTSVTIPDSVASIGDGAFYYCNNLTDVYYTGSEEQWREISVGVYNQCLTNANIIFDYIWMPALIEYASAFYDCNKVTAKINFNYIEQAGTLYVAVYDEGKLVTIQDKPVAVDETENTIEIINTDENYKGCDVKVFYWDSNSSIKPLAKFVETKIAEAILVDDVLESEHPYANSMDETKTYVYDGECVSIDVTFSDDTETESGYDYIYIYDSNDNQIGEYTGTELGGKTINVPGNTVKIRLTSDSSASSYGYRTESIVVNK